jgi:DNA invertase Pin-like site-specific DNA recombinase
MGKMVFTVIAAVAELERSLIQERVVMGMARAKAQGKHIGQPRGTKVDVEKLWRLKADGKRPDPDGRGAVRSHGALLINCRIGVVSRIPAALGALEFVPA